MPTLHLRQVPPDLMARLRAGAREREVPIDEYAISVLEHGTEAMDARARGARAVNDRLTPEERSERARKAVMARHAKETRSHRDDPDDAG